MAPDAGGLEPATLWSMVLADGRLPVGTYAHSLGLEEAVGQGQVRDLDDVATYATGVLATVGVGGAALAVAAWQLTTTNASPAAWCSLDAEADARMASPLQRRAARQLGRHLLRLAPALGPAVPACLQAAAAGHGDGPHQSLATGALGAAVGLSASQTAVLSLYGTATVVSQAAVRLLGIDPLAATASVVALGPWITGTASAVAADVTARTATDLADLPAPAAPLLDHYLLLHDQRPERLFVT